MIKITLDNALCNSQDYNYCDFKYPLDEFQKNALVSIAHDENVLVCAATGNGKTSIAIAAIKNAFDKNKRVIYTAPIKALLNQKYDEFKNIFEKVGIETGDVKICPDEQCVVMTTEILRNKILLNDAEILKDVCCVIFDEVHYIKDHDRGNVWETCISVLPSFIQQVMLSATIHQPELFAMWITQVQPSRDLHLIQVSQRKVPLEYFYFVEKDIVKIMDNEKNFDNSAYTEVLKYPKTFFSEIKVLNDVIKFLKNKDMFPCAFFVMSKKNCEHYANSVTVPIIDNETSSNAVNEFNKLLLKDSELERYSSQVQLMRNLVAKGVGIHHAGLNPILKEIIEKLFGGGFLKVLFATGTFTVGLNMPIRTVVLTCLTVMSENGLRNFTPDEFIQMCGRAGRRGLDKKGNVVISLLKESPLELYEIRNMMTMHPDSVSSRLKVDNNLVIDLISSGKNKQQINEFVENSLFGSEQNKEIHILKEEKRYFKNFSLDERKREKLNDYIILKEKLSVPMRQNQMKKLNFKIQELQKDNELRKIIEEYENFLKEKQKYDNICHKINYLENINIQSIDNIMYFLKDHDFIDENNSLTRKGLIASKIHGYDKVFLTEIILSDFFSEFSIIQIGLLFSMFMKYETVDEIDIFEELNFVYEKVKTLYAFDENNVNFSFCSSLFSWMTYQTVKNVNTYNEGNFIVQVNLVCQLLDSIITVCEEFEFNTLYKKISELKNIIKRDIVITQSLYV